MKKFINTVWKIYLPSEPIYVDGSITEPTVREFARGRGKWGDNALYEKVVKSETVFETIQEAKDYVEYTKVMDDNLKTILNDSDNSRIAGIVQFMQNYVDGTVSPDEYKVIPTVASGELLVKMAEVFSPNFVDLTEEEQATLIEQMGTLYGLVKNQPKS